MFALQFRQRLTGAYGLDLDARDHLGKPLALRAELRAPSLRGLLSRDLQLRGEITAAGFADHRPIEGTVSLPQLRTLRIHFDFSSNSGAPHSFVGEQQLTLWPLAQSLTVLRGTIATATGDPVGRALLRFDLRHDLWPLLRSIECRV